MNYQHLYHAGSFSDVFKHILLTALLLNLQRKDKAYCYLDTHSGAGKYDLYTEAAQKTKEFATGIGTLLTHTDLPPLVADYVKAVQAMNRIALTPQTIRFYPGSPRIARYFARANDRLILCELHPATMTSLRDEFHHDDHTAVHHADGYHALKAFLPPLERRGCVLIDPPFEKRDEFKKMAAALREALTRWATGIYAIWYPIKSNGAHKGFLAELKRTITSPILCAELAVFPADSPMLLNGCGMVIINPPWQLDKNIRAVLPWLWRVLSVEGQGNYRVGLL